MIDLSSYEFLLENKEDNLEYDLYSTDWIIAKVKSDEVYAQHLYAALCNNVFTPNKIWPILLEKTWSCSWRHAGAILSIMDGTNDYLNFYLSGLAANEDIEYSSRLSLDQQIECLKYKAYVAEGVVTEEIRQDLFRMGWILGKDDRPD